MKITTKTGDDQTTFLRKRRAKDDIRVEVLGMIDELLAMCHLFDHENSLALFDLKPVIKHLNTMLANLAVEDYPFSEENVAYLEDFVKGNEQYFKDLDHFIQPNSVLAAKINVLRTRVRTLERRFATLSKQESVDSSVLIYMNRLSDYFFVMMILANNQI